MNFAIVNLGCKVNKVESDDAAAFLLAAGWACVDEAAADLIVVNTCTVTGEAEKKTRKAVRHALRANEKARVLVTGCAAAITPEFYETLDARVKVVPKAQLGEALSRECEQLEADAGHANASVLRVGEGFRTRVGVKVQDGCDNACTYCIVHVARGRATSRPADEVVAECAALARAGAREIVLSGINIGSYCNGVKRDPQAVRLPELLRRLLVATADCGEPFVRFRISSIEPRDVSDELIELMAASRGRICRHLHLPLQAGSSKVLREMARPYTADDFAVLVGRMRAAMPQLSLSTDIIVGFPGETEEEFAETLSLARRCAFSRIHVFPYSRREGTPAAARTDQIAPEVKARRAAELRALGEELAAADFAARAGSREWALVEPEGIAVTESYHEIPAPPDAAPGSLVSVEL